MTALDRQAFVRLDTATFERLDALVAAGPAGLNRSDYIRRAIAELLERESS